jgi:hypothetical protein
VRATAEHRQAPQPVKLVKPEDPPRNAVAPVPPTPPAPPKSAGTTSDPGLNE